MRHFIFPDKRSVVRGRSASCVSTASSLGDHPTHHLGYAQIHLWKSMMLRPLCRKPIRVSKLSLVAHINTANVRMTVVKNRVPQKLTNKCSVSMCSTWSHSSPANGWAGPGNQPERLATRRAVAGFHTISLLEEAEIWVSGSRPDSIPCRSEHGASGVQGREGRGGVNLHFREH